MKTSRAIAKVRPLAGIMLVQCLVYFAVFTLLTAIGFADFYKCWNHSVAVMGSADDITAALRAGERWRADVRAAAGPVSVQTTAAGEQVRIPGRDHAVVYQFGSGEVRREIPGSNASQLLLPRVKSSQTTMENRDGVTAWRWELEITSRRPETRFPMLFTFEAAQPHP